MNKLTQIVDTTAGKLLTRYIAKNQKKVIDKNISSAYFNYLMSNLNDGKILPYNSMSISPLAMMLIINHILIHDIKYIVEFGTGISTIFLNNLSKKNSLNLKIISVDHDSEWQKIFQKKYNLEFVEFIHSPLTNKMEFKTTEFNWYNTDFLNNIEKDKVELVIVDAPIGLSSPYERAGAFDFFKAELSKANFTILLDDTNFKELDEIMHHYCPKAKKYDEFSIYGNGIKFRIDPVLLSK